MRRFFTTMFTMLLCGTMMTQMADAQSRGRGRQNGEGGSRTENVQRPSRQNSNRQEGFSRRENNRPANISRPENKRPGNNVGNFRPANNNSGNGNGFNRPGNMGNRDQHTVNPGNLNRPGNNGNRPGNGNNNGAVHRPGHGNNNGSVNRPGNQNRPGNGNNFRPGNNGNRPGNDHGNRPNGNWNRPGGNHNPGYVPNRPNHGHNDRPGYRPNHGPNHRPGYRPPYHAHAPMRPYMPVNRPWRPPVPPRHWRPYHGAPRFSTILGITLGTAIDITINSLLNSGYNVTGYGPNVVYLNSVPMMNFTWPNATFNYVDGAFRGSEFTYSTPGYDMSRYNMLYNQLISQYGYPVSVQNNGGDSVSATWWGYNNGYITLSFFPDYAYNGSLRYYTTFSVGN